MRKGSCCFTESRDTTVKGGRSMDVKNNEGYTNIPEAVAVFRVDRERERLAWIRRKRAGRAIFLIKLFLDFMGYEVVGRISIKERETGCTYK